VSFRAASALALVLAPTLGAQRAALTTGGGIARLDQLSNQPISTVGLAAGADFGPLVFDATGSTVSYRELGYANRVNSSFWLKGGERGWNVAGGPVLDMGSTVGEPWTTAWSGAVRIRRTLGFAILEVNAAEGLTHPYDQRVSFGRRGAAADLKLGAFTLRTSYDLTIMRDSTLRDDVFFDPGTGGTNNAGIFRDRVRQVHDAAMTIGVTVRDTRLAATLGQRSGDDIATQTFWRVDADFAVAQAASIVFSTSRNPADVVLGLRGGRSTTLGFRIAIPDQKSGGAVLFDIPVEVVRQTPDLVRVVLTLPSGSRALLMGEITNWQPVELMSLGKGRFEGWFKIPPGTYRINVAIDEGPWIAPPGMPRVEDGFGGIVGLLDL
jgi:hypothetical protein